MDVLESIGRAGFYLGSTTVQAVFWINPPVLQWIFGIG
jgi:hypothetical protein